MILIIDDDIAVRTSLLLLLRQEGFEASAVGTPEKAMETISQTRPDLILLDLNFSNRTTGEEGMALLSRIKQYDQTLPVILITGWGSIELAVQGMKLGAADFITKPWSNDALLQSVRTVLALQNKKPVRGVTRKQLDKDFDFRQIIGKTPPCCRCSKPSGA